MSSKMNISKKNIEYIINYLINLLSCQIVQCLYVVFYLYRGIYLLFSYIFPLCILKNLNLFNFMFIGDWEIM